MKKVVIIGGGFGGLAAAKVLAKYSFDITIVDKTNHHLFQPLLYQVATAALSPGDIANPIRSILANRQNVKVVMAEVTSIDKVKREVKFKSTSIAFDYLIIAVGSSYSYFGNEGWEQFAPGLKTLNDALKIRESILLSLEAAERLTDKSRIEEYLNFVIVGGGPTGVELAGAIAEIVNKNYIKDFRNINEKMTKVFLVEALPRLLQAFPENLSAKALDELKYLEVEVLLNRRVTGIDENGVHLGDDFIKTKNIIWAAGNTASSLLETLGIELDGSGRGIVQPDLSIKDDPDIFIIGDAAVSRDEKGKFLPELAPVAMQQGRYVAGIISKEINSIARKRFKYRDKGVLTTIRKGKSVAVIKGLKLSGLIAWLTWSFVHIFYLINFRNRIRVMTEWAWYFITNRPGIRLIVKKSNKDLDSWLV
ncbi:MAG: NAD(P)/FAD-dependent oxidoreductase [Bacteroidetes bacterium]|nr:NAD(P)/FAD-dependent oxidoreductase [Bacteroidota bacterium]